MVSLEELNRQLAEEKAKVDRAKKQSAIAAEKAKVKYELFKIKHQKKMAVLRGVGGVVKTIGRGFRRMATHPTTKRIGKGIGQRLGTAGRSMYESLEKQGAGMTGHKRKVVKRIRKIRKIKKRKR